MLSAEQQRHHRSRRAFALRQAGPLRLSRYRGAKPQVSVRCIVAELCVFQFVAPRGGGPLRP